jgi:hypothetical protein
VPCGGGGGGGVGGWRANVSTVQYCKMKQFTVGVWDN